MDVRIGQMDATVRATAPAPANGEAPTSLPAAATRVRAEERPPGLEADRRLRSRLTLDERRPEVSG
jgi:hypothetical protein